MTVVHLLRGVTKPFESTTATDSLLDIHTTRASEASEGVMTAVSWRPFPPTSSAIALMFRSIDVINACSAAAGPALEGAKIQFGMRGASGAIDHVWLENGELQCSVIGGGEAKGICGSGIIDAVAAAIESGLLNKRGRIQLKEEINGQILFQSFRCF